MKKLEVIVPNGRLPEVDSILRKYNVGGLSHYRIEGAGRVKADPVVEATHPMDLPQYLAEKR